MKIQVIRCDGQIETLTLVGPLAVTESAIMPHLQDATGMDHYFNPDGTYDGWGRSSCGMSAEDAKRLIETTELCREVRRPTGETP